MFFVGANFLLIFKVSQVIQQIDLFRRSKRALPLERRDAHVTWPSWRPAPSDAHKHSRASQR